MFDKRLMELCPESKQYIVGNILFQWLELFMNAIMIYLIAYAIDHFYYRGWNTSDLVLPVLGICLTVVVRFFTTQA
ncbi:MAG: hypothetical protein J6D36_03035, partial [Erysipelotrichaceae bacterium]|nr:hypothetical protein [Erysipelotrichaceae bacterium]